MQNQKREFEIKSLIVFTLSMIANVMGVIFQSLAGHLLNDTKMFAELNAVMALFNILVLPTTIASCFIVKYTAQYWANDQYGIIKQFLIRMTQILIIGVAVFIIVMLIFQKWLAKWLYIDDLYIIVLAIILAGITLLSAVFTGGLQGMQSFVLYGIFGLVGPLFKIIAVTFSALVRRKIAGILTIWLVGTVVSYIVGFFFLKKILGNYRKEKICIEKKEAMQYICKLLTTNVGLILITNIDILLIKHNFNVEAGLYSAALMLGKIVTYFTGAFVVVLFPMAATEKETDRENFALFKKAILYNVIIGIEVVAVINFWADFCIRILLGNEYLACKTYLIPVSLYVLPLSILNLIANYTMARKNTEIISASLLMGCIIEIFGSMWINKSVIKFIWFISIVMWILVVINMIQLFAKNKEVEEEQ